MNPASGTASNNDICVEKRYIGSIALRSTAACADASGDSTYRKDCRTISGIDAILRAMPNSAAAVAPAAPGIMRLSKIGGRSLYARRAIAGGIIAAPFASTDLRVRCDIGARQSRLAS